MEYICILTGSNESRIFYGEAAAAAGCKCRGCSTPHSPVSDLSVQLLSVQERVATSGKHLQTHWPLVGNTFQQAVDGHYSTEALRAIHLHHTTMTDCQSAVRLKLQVVSCPPTWTNLLAWELMRRKLGVSPQCDTSCISLTSQKSEV